MKRSITRTPYIKLVELAFEVKAQLLLPQKLFELPIIKLPSPVTALLAPTITLLYAMNYNFILSKTEAVYSIEALRA